MFNNYPWQERDRIHLEYFIIVLLFLLDRVLFAFVWNELHAKLELKVARYKNNFVF